MPSLYEFTASLPSAAAASVSQAGPIHSLVSDPACPACGATHGNCTGEEHMAKTDDKNQPEGDKAPGDDQPAAEAHAAKAAAPATGGTGPQLPGEHVPDQSATAIGAIINQPENSFGEDGGKVAIKTEAVEGSKLLRVTEDVTQTFFALGAKRPSTRLIASKGQLLTEEQVQALKA